MYRYSGNSTEELKTYHQALVALRDVINTAAVQVDSSKLTFMPWQKKNSSSRFMKIHRVRKNKEKALKEAKHSLNELLSLEIADDLLDGLLPVSTEKNYAIRSKISGELDKRKKPLTKKALRKLKKIGYGHFQSDKSIFKYGDSRYSLAFDQEEKSPTALSSNVKKGLEALNIHSHEMKDGSEGKFYEIFKEVLSSNERFNEFEGKARELVDLLDEMIKQMNYYSKNKISGPEVEFSMSQKEYEKMLALREDLQNMISLIGEKRSIDERIKMLEYNIKYLSANSNELAFQSAGQKLIKELNEEYEKALKMDKIRQEELRDKLDYFGRSTHYERIRDVISYIDHSKNFVFEYDRLRYNNGYREVIPSMPYKEKRAIMLEAISEIAKARTLQEEYLRYSAGKGPDRMTFSAFAAEKAKISPVYAAYEDSYEEEKKKEEEKGKNLKRGVRKL